MNDDLTNVLSIGKNISNHLSTQSKHLDSIETGIHSLAKHFNESLRDTLKKVNNNFSDDLNYIERTYFVPLRLFTDSMKRKIYAGSKSAFVKAYAYTIKTSTRIVKSFKNFKDAISKSVGIAWKKFTEHKGKWSFGYDLKTTIGRQVKLWSSVWKNFTESEAIKYFSNAFSEIKMTIQSEIESILGPDIMKFVMIGKSIFKILWKSVSGLGKALKDTFSGDLFAKEKIPKTKTEEAIEEETDVFIDLKNYFKSGGIVSTWKMIGSKNETVEKEKLSDKIRKILGVFSWSKKEERLAEAREGKSNNKILDMLKGNGAISGILTLITGLLGPVFGVLGTGIKLISRFMLNPYVLAFLYLGVILYKAFSAFKDKEVNNIFGGDGILPKIGSAVAGAISGMTLGFVNAKDVAKAMVEFGRMVSESWTSLINWTSNIDWLSPFKGFITLIEDAFSWIGKKFTDILPDWAKKLLGLDTSEENPSASKASVPSASKASVPSASKASVPSTSNVSIPQGNINNSNNLTNNLTQKLGLNINSDNSSLITKDEFIKTPSKELSKGIINAEDMKATIENKLNKKEVEDFGKMVLENNNNNINTSNNIVEKKSVTIDQSIMPQFDIPLTMPIPFALVNG